VPSQHIRSELRPSGVAPSEWATIAELRPDDQLPDVLSVISEQERIEACYRDSRNGIFWFTKFYISVTKGVQRELAGGHLPARAAEFLKRLDIRFYGYYRNALCETDAEDPVRIAWTPLLRRLSDHRTHPMVFALLGINAHITCDLPQAILDTLWAMGYAEFPGADSDEREVFFALNRILRRVAVNILRKDFVSGLPGLAHDLFPQLIEEEASRYIKFVREQAWYQARTLWDLSRADGLAGGPEDPTLLQVRQLLAQQARCFNDCLFKELPLRTSIGIWDIARWTGDALGRRWRRTGPVQRD
jgi:hypothetical protein